MSFSIQLSSLEDSKTSKTVQHVTQLIQQLSASASIETVERTLASPLHHVFMARDTKGVIIGIATLAVSHCMTGTRAHIEDVLVTSTWRGKGVGKALLAACIQLSQTTVATKTLNLTSRPDRVAANTLYKKLGFVKRETNVYRYMPDNSLSSYYL